MTRDVGPIIDVDVHHTWKSDQDIIKRLPRQLRDLATGAFGAPISIRPTDISYRSPSGGRRLETYPANGEPPGSSYEMLRDQHLDKYGVEHALLLFDTGRNAALTNPYLAQATVRAMNDWTVEEWLGRGDSRVLSAMVVPTQIISEGAAEIRRIGQHPGIAAALISWNGLGKPLGHPEYHPLYEAAAEVGLPIALHSPSAEYSGGIAHPTAGGLTGSYFEFHTLLNQAPQNHLASLLVHGVFEKFPTLNVLLIESGIAWIPWLLWSLDEQFETLRHESPLLRRLPSEYFKEHLYLSTQPLDTSNNPKQLIDVLEAIDGIEDMLCFSSDYPHWDFDDPFHVARRIPTAWHDRLFRGNARKVLRIPGSATSATTSANLMGTAR